MIRALLILFLLFTSSTLFAQEEDPKRAQADDQAERQADEETVEKEHADETVKKDGKKIVIGGRTRSELATAANKNRKLRMRAAANRQRQRSAQKAHPTTSRGGITMNKPEPANPRETTARKDLAERSAVPVGDKSAKPPEGSIVVTAGRTQYHYAADRFYQKQGEGFVVVPPPIGALIPERPGNSSTVRAGSKRYFYQGGYFYEQEGRAGYRVVAPPTGAVVPYLPKGYAPKIVYGDRYYAYAGATYNPVTVNGKRYYQVVRIRGR